MPIKGACFLNFLAFIQSCFQSSIHNRGREERCEDLHSCVHLLLNRENQTMGKNMSKFQLEYLKKSRQDRKYFENNIWLWGKVIQTIDSPCYSFSFSLFFLSYYNTHFSCCIGLMREIALVTLIILVLNSEIRFTSVFLIVILN